MNKMTLTHVGILLAGVAIGYFVGKSKKKGFANVGGPVSAIPNCNTQCTNSPNYSICLDTCKTVGPTAMMANGRALK